MIRRKSFVALAVGTTLLLLPPALSYAEQVQSAVASNVLVKITLAKQEDGGQKVQKSYEMVCPGDGERSEIGSGYRIPIPTTTFNTSNAAGSSIVPVTSFTYQNVGFSATFRARVLNDGRVSLIGSVEESFPSGSSTSAQGLDLPRIAFYQHEVNAVLEDGVGLQTTVYADSVVGPLDIELVAVVLN